MARTLHKYGAFIENGRCFELKNEPPKKWVNLHYNKIGNDEMYAEISNIGDGVTWVRDNDGVTVELIGYDAKYVYIRDAETGKVFSPGGAPAPTKVEDFSCKYWHAKTEITGTFDGIKATQRMFVPRDYVAEVWTVTLENKTDRKRKLDVFAYAMFQLTGCDSEGKYVPKTNYSVVRPDLGGVTIINRNTQCPTDKFKGYIVALNGYKAADGYRDYFLRSDFSVGAPKILFGYDCSNKDGYGPDCAGAIQTEIEIEPNSTARVDFVIGQYAQDEDIKKIIKEFTVEKIEAMCQEQIDYEDKHTESFRIDIGNEAQNALMNYFVKKQMNSYLINKSGFRDNLQCDYAFSMVDYEIAKDNFLRALSSQYPNGLVIHGFRPKNRLTYSDKPAWILMVAPALIKESGDFSLLDEVVPYFESDEVGTVWDHMIRTMRYMANDLGIHGLCLQHHADWNDGLEATPETGERESVMVTEQLCYGLLEIIEIAKRRGEDDIVKEAQEKYDHFAKKINEEAWDGEWYNRFLCEDGYKAGSHINEEGKIFINGNTWAVLSQIADEKRAIQCMDSLEKELGTKIGYKLVSPPYSKYDPRIGGISNSMPGNAENGGCYNHAAGFKAVADCMLGRAEEAWKTWNIVCPDNPDNPIEVSQMEPFSFTNSFTQVEYVYGQAGYPWRTGTAGWFTILIVEWILGARRHYDGLMIDPCMSKELPKASITRTFRGAKYNINIDNTAGNCKGVKKITVDGKEIEGNILPDFREGTHEVEVIL